MKQSVSSLRSMSITKRHNIMSELELRNISKKYKTVLALNEFSFSFTPGVYGILGPNGAGKSTMMNIITDNLKQTDGAVFYDGTDIRKLGKNYRSHIGYMPQQQEVYAELTLNRFLYYIASLKGIRKRDADVQIEDLLCRVNMSDKRGMLMGQLSGGMKQRALIVQALIGAPDILILDEPTAGLDPKERVRIRNLISSVARDKIVLISTHVVSDIEFISKEVLFLKKGKLLRAGSVAELCREMDGRVYELRVTPDEALSVEQKYKCSNMSSEAELVKVRLITDHAPSGAICVNAGLEDLYLELFE